MCSGFHCAPQSWMFSWNFCNFTREEITFRLLIQFTRALWPLWSFAVRVFGSFPRLSANQYSPFLFMTATQWLIFVAWPALCKVHRMAAQSWDPKILASVGLCGRSSSRTKWQVVCPLSTFMIWSKEIGVCSRLVTIRRDSWFLLTSASFTK